MMITIALALAAILAELLVTRLRRTGAAASSTSVFWTAIAVCNLAIIGFLAAIKMGFIPSTIPNFALLFLIFVYFVIQGSRIFRQLQAMGSR
jgi:hypothetical protein